VRIPKPLAGASGTVGGQELRQNPVPIGDRLDRGEKAVTARRHAVARQQQSRPASSRRDAFRPGGIRIDSTEERILAGASETLCDPDLRSVLIELEEAHTARNDRLTSALKAAGFSLSLRSKEAQNDVVNCVFVRTSVSAGASARTLL
jgi:hypothetical protein